MENRKKEVEDFYLLPKKSHAYCFLFTFQEKLQKHNFIICGNDDCGTADNVFSFSQPLAM